MKHVPLALLAILLGTAPAAADDRTEQQKRVDRAIASALAELAELQQPSGAWPIGVRPDRRSSGGQESTAMTSLAVMAFMAAGHVPGEGPHGDSLEKAIRWVVDQQHDNGLLLAGRGNRHGSMYEHGISTLMLAETAGMTGEADGRRVRDALEKAIALILEAQLVDKDRRQEGGWRYTPTSTDSDLSVTGWQLLALRAAKDVGCDVPAENIDMAVDYVRRCSVRNRGFAYQPGNGVTATRSGTGILCLEVCGEHHAAESIGAAEALLDRPLDTGESWFYYGAYYCTVGMFKMGEKYWTATRDHMIDLLLDERNADGTWFSPQDGETRGGVVYCTSLSVLALAVEYQYLPIYQR